MISIVPLQIEHIDELYQLEKASFSEPWSQMMFIKELEKPQTYYFVAMEDEKIIGYAGMWVVMDEAHVMNIAVDQSKRRHGTGKRLLKTLLDKARQLDLIGLTLEVRAGNMPAISLYQSLGFFSVGQREDYYRYPLEDALIMWHYFGDGSQG